MTDVDGHAVTVECRSILPKSTTKRPTPPTAGNAYEGLVFTDTLTISMTVTPP